VAAVTTSLQQGDMALMAAAELVRLAVAMAEVEAPQVTVRAPLLQLLPQVAVTVDHTVVAQAAVAPAVMAAPTAAVVAAATGVPLVAVADQAGADMTVEAEVVAAMEAVVVGVVIETVEIEEAALVAAVGEVVAEVSRKILVVIVAAAAAGHHSGPDRKWKYNRIQSSSPEWTVMSQSKTWLSILAASV